MSLALTEREAESEESAYLLKELVSSLILLFITYTIISIKHLQVFVINDFCDHNS